MDNRKLLAEIKAQQAELQEAVFRSPPANMEQFTHRLGQWLGFEHVAGILAEAIRKADDEEDLDT